MMQLSDRTLSILKNFASINSGLVLRPGKVQRTMSPEQTILVQANLDELFTQTFGVYDLNQFLGNITTLNNPFIDFLDDKNVNLKDDVLELTYRGCDTNLIISPPEGKDLVMKNPDVSFNLPMTSLQKILKIGAMNNLPNISIIGDKASGSLFIRSHELKNDLSNVANMKVGDHHGEDFSVSFKMENLKMIADDYKVEIKVGGFSCWTNATNTLTYFVAMEKK
jgi:hypothetical protein